MDVQILFLPTDLPFHYQQYPHDLAPISVELCYVWSVAQGSDATGSRTVIGETILLQDSEKKNINFRIAQM
jgi:hypothetical protein